MRCKLFMNNELWHKCVVSESAGVRTGAARKLPPDGLAGHDLIIVTTDCCSAQFAQQNRYSSRRTRSFWERNQQLSVAFRNSISSVGFLLRTLLPGEPRHVHFHRGRIQSLARTAQKCAPEPFRSSHADRILHDADRLHLHWLAHAAGAQLSLERIQRDSGRHSQVVSVFESVTDHYLASNFMISRSDGVSKRPGNVRRCMVRFQSSFLRAIAMSIPSGTLIC